MNFDLTHSVIAGITVLGCILVAVLGPSWFQGISGQQHRPMKERATLLSVVVLLSLAGFVFRACFRWPARDLFSGLAGAEVLSMCAYFIWLRWTTRDFEEATHFRLPMRFHCWAYFKELGIATLFICVPWLAGLHLGTLFLGKR